MSGYFQYLPNIYVANGIVDGEPVEYTLVKNIFKRLAVKDINQKFSSFERARIDEGDTPSSIALEYYGDPLLDWCILLTNNITDVYNDWPKEAPELLRYVRLKYNDDTSGVHHWETQEVEYEGEVFIKGGIEVTEAFRVVLPDGTTLSKGNSIVLISNYEHEEYLNELKRFIKLPTPTTVALMKDEMNEGLIYKNCPELDEDGNKKTPVSLVSRFLTNNTAVTRTQNVQTEIVTSFDTAAAATGAVGISTSSSTSTTSDTSTSSSSSSSGSSSSSSSGGGYGGY